MSKLKYSKVHYDDDFISLMQRFGIRNDWYVEVNAHRCRSKKRLRAWRIFKCNPYFQGELVRYRFDAVSGVNESFEDEFGLQSFFDFFFPDERFRY